MEMAPNDTTDQSSFSNISQNPEESGEKLEIDQDDKMVVDDAPTPAEDNVESRPPSLSVPQPPAVAPILIPSMRGMMTYAGGSITCKGKWAMSDAAHDVPGQTSDFEFKLVKKDEACTNIFPVDGIYQGWFMLRQALPAKGSVRIDDREMEIHFQPTEDENSYKVTGHGCNKFGLFNLSGTLSELGAVHIYRDYYQLTPQPAATPTVKKSTIGRPEGIQRRPSVGVDPTLEATPREGAGRIRKQSSVMKEYQELAQKPVPTPRPAATTVPSSSSASSNFFPDPPAPIQSSVSSSSLARQNSVEQRTHRLPAVMRKCADLLREMSKLPQSRWFLEPVDAIKLGIPDYPKIIKTPMDFSTIRVKIESNDYETIDAFAEDMRLVFRNAMTFNSAKDNIVHINAKEVSSKFEDRYRMIIAQLEGHVFTTATSLPPAESKLARSASTTSFASSSKAEKQAAAAAASAAAAAAAASSSSSKKRASLAGGSSSTAAASSSSGAGRPSNHSRDVSSGPRQSLAFVPPAAVDSNVSQIIELQRQMAAMKEEIDRLRAQLNEKEVAKAIQETKEAAQTPLTYEEKRQLVNLVSKLPAEKMDELVKIIRDGLPDEKKNDDISEVPLEILDTLTLRRLQKFVKESTSGSKKRMSSGMPRAKSEPSLKKAKKAAAAEAASNSGFANGAPATAEHGDIELFDHEELLLETEKFVTQDHDGFHVTDNEQHYNNNNSNNSNSNSHHNSHVETDDSGANNHLMMMDTTETSSVYHHESTVMVQEMDSSTTNENNNHNNNATDMSAGFMMATEVVQVVGGDGEGYDDGNEWEALG